METLMEDKSGSKDDETLIVSWDSLERRKKELDEINTVKIPQNKKDIQVAREYGDLRENFEYKSAKQQQAVLLRMQSKIERELGLARGTDFANTPTDKVGTGTIVDIEDVNSGEKETYTILGAWDGDVDKGIISYLSESGKALIGHAVGDEVELPADSDQGNRTVKVLDIRAFNTGEVPA
jgi:transcription elongation GreA/GreB family factor